MKTLTLLRHAKSGWDDMSLRDFDRRLNDKGKRAAATVGRHMRSEGLTFDHVVASPAVRVVETLEGVASGYGRGLDPTWDRRVYLASVATLLDLIHDLPGEHARVLLVGHNPGLHELAVTLVGAHAMTPDNPDMRRLSEGYPSGALTEFTVPGPWRELGEGGGRLVRFLCPRDLPPS